MSEMKPDAVGFDITAIEMPGVDSLKGFQIHDRGEFYELVLGPESPTTNLPIGSRLDFSLHYYKDGQQIRFEDQTPPALHLYHTSQLLAVCGSGSAQIGPDAPYVDDGDRTESLVKSGGVANWTNRWEKTGGMDPTLVIKSGANEQAMKVIVSVPMAGVKDKTLVLPKVS